MSDDKNCACQPDVAIAFDDLRVRYRELAEENLRLRMLMQKDTTVLAKEKEKVLALEKQVTKLFREINTLKGEENAT